MHHHIDRQVVCRDLHATRRRETGCRVTHNVCRIVHIDAAVCAGRLHKLAIAEVVEAGELCRIEHIDIVAARQTEAVDYVLLDILVETHARNLFEDRTCEVQTHIRIAVARTRLILEI